MQDRKTPNSFLDQSWSPVAFTQPLVSDFTSDGPRLIEFVEKYWKTPDGKPLKLDEWQKALLCHILETYPDGTLRYRQVVVSMGRQNGKSVIAAILSAYGLLQQCKGPTVVGVASSADQARIIYERTHYVIKNTSRLNKIIKATSTRGLGYRDGSGSYVIKASKGESLQGLPITLGLADELHIMDEDVWDSIVTGQRAQKNALIIGITTAGDDTSTLLKRLYKDGYSAINGGNERFGFFLWEAPEGSTIHDDEALKAANPAIACGRIDLATARADIASQPVSQQERYGLNRFVKALESWLPLHYWSSLPKKILSPQADLVFALDKSGGSEDAPDFVSITVNFKDDQGVLYTNYAASMVNRSHADIVAKCIELAKHPRAVFAMDSKMFPALGKELKERGLNVRMVNALDVADACATVYSAIKNKRVRHDHHAWTTEQVPRGRVKTIGDGWAISRIKSSGETDALMSTVIGLYVADTQPKRQTQLF